MMVGMLVDGGHVDMDWCLPSRNHDPSDFTDPRVGTRAVLIV